MRKKIGKTHDEKGEEKEGKTKNAMDKLKSEEKRIEVS